MELELITQAIYTIGGLSALAVVLTQIFKNWWNQKGIKWIDHALSAVAAIICNGGVLAVGLIWSIGIYADFDPNNITSWVMWIGTTLGCTLVANGMWTYDIMKKFLEWLKLMPIKMNQAPNMITEEFQEGVFLDDPKESE